MRNSLKKISLSLIACLIGTVLFAQQQKSANYAEIDNAVKTKTAALKKQLNLSDEQEKSVFELTRSITYKSAAGDQQQAELDGYYNDEISKILDTGQMEKYLTLKNNNFNATPNSAAKKSKTVRKN